MVDLKSKNLTIERATPSEAQAMGREFILAKKRGEKVQEVKSPSLGATGTNGVTMEQFAERFIMINGRPFSLNQQPHLRPIYNRFYPKLLIMSGRQVAKSTSLANFIVYHSSVTPHFKSIYVSPSSIQTSQFSNDRLRATIEYSPTIRRELTSTKCIKKVLQRTFTNGSNIHLRYCYLNADRVRGLSASLLCVDELQDLLTENLPVVEETLSFKIEPGEMKIQVYTGTPKTTTSAMQSYWERSTQTEWLVPCNCVTLHLMGPGSSKQSESKAYWNYLDDSSVGPEFLQCKRCKKQIYPQRPDATWVDLNKGAKWKGYRISQLMVSWIKHDDILEKRKHYSTQKFHNEVLGLPYDSGVKPVTEWEIRQCCDNELQNQIQVDPIFFRYPIVMGIDWAGPSAEDPESSHTVLTFGAIMDGKRVTIFHIKKLLGRESDLSVQPKIVAQMMRNYQVQLVGCDWGFGADKNAVLREGFGHHKVMEIQYVSSKLRAKFDGASQRYLVDRTIMMSELFMDIKKQNIKFFNYDEFKEYAVEMMNIETEYNESRQIMHYNHQQGKPDDVFHSILYCKLAANYYYRGGTI